MLSQIGVKFDENVNLAAQLHQALAITAAPKKDKTLLLLLLYNKPR